MKNNKNIVRDIFKKLNKKKKIVQIKKKGTKAKNLLVAVFFEVKTLSP